MNENDLNSKPNSLVSKGFNSTAMQYILRTRDCLKMNQTTKKKLKEMEYFLKNRAKKWQNEQNEKIQAQ